MNVKDQSSKIQKKVTSFNYSIQYIKRNNKEKKKAFQLEIFQACNS